MKETTLPRLMLIADGFASGRGVNSAEDVQLKVVKLVAAGVAFVQLRDHETDPGTFADAARFLESRLRVVRPDCIIVVNARPDVATELRCGLHLGRSGASQVPPVAGDGDDAICHPTGFSAHTLDDVKYAKAIGFDYVAFSPIFPTETHPERQALGLDALERACQIVPGYPIFALGGIDPERARECREVGAYGVAVLSDLLDAADPVPRLSSYRKAGVL